MPEDETELNNLFNIDNVILPPTLLTPNFSEHSHSQTDYGDGIVYRELCIKKWFKSAKFLEKDHNEKKPDLYVCL